MQELKSLFERYDNIVFFDTETTGLDPNGDQVIEIAAISFRENEVVEMDEFVTLRDADARLPEKIVELTGITDEMLSQHGITEQAAAEEFAEIVNGAESGQSERTLLVAHNANFDLCFVRWWLVAKRLPILEFVDTVTVFKDRRAYPHKLSNAIAAYHLQDKVQNTHRAIDDVRALVEVTKAMAAERDDLLRYVNLFGYNPKYGAPPNRIKGVRYVPQRFNDYMTSVNNALYALR